MKFIDVHENDYSNEIILPMDATLRVALRENPSTGYRWQVEDISRNCLRMISKKFGANHAHAIGSAGIAVFYFKPIKPGRCTLYLKLWRSWEGDTSIVKRFQKTVSIISG